VQELRDAASRLAQEKAGWRRQLQDAQAEAQGFKGQVRHRLPAKTAQGAHAQ
jgi:hypothetical protein